MRLALTSVTAFSEGDPEYFVIRVNEHEIGFMKETEEVALFRERHGPLFARVAVTGNRTANWQ